MLGDHATCPGTPTPSPSCSGPSSRGAGRRRCARWRTVAEILAARRRVRARLDRLGAPAVAASVADARAHLDRLVRPGFVVAGRRPPAADVVRYVRAIEYRLERLAEDVPRDLRRMAEVRPLEQRYAALLGDQRHRRERADAAEAADLGWALEELRVSVFAQPLGARGGVSPTRIRRRLDALR